MKLTTLFVAAALATAADSNWPQFRGAGASGIGNGATPIQWDGEKGDHVLWKTEIPGLGHSSPVIWGDRIFVTSAVPANGEASLKVGLYGNIEPVEGEGAQAFTVYCLDRKSGKILWQRAAVTGQAKIKRHPKSTHANPTPATDGKTLVVSFGSEGLFAFDFSGKQLWKKDFGILDSGYYMVPAAQWGFASSPVIHDGKVIIQADVQKNSFVAALDLATGKELWRTPRTDVPTFGTPAVLPYTAWGARGMQVVVNGWKQIGGYDFETGKELWKLKGGGDIPVPTPVFLDGLIVITSAHGSERPIYAIRTDAAGELTADNKSMAWMQARAGNYMQTPVLHDGLGYFCYDNGVLTVYQLSNGEKLYQQRLGTGTAGFSGSAVIGGGHLYITNEEGHTYVLAPGREYKLIGQNELGETVMSTPAIADGVLYIRARKHLFAVGDGPPARR